MVEDATYNRVLPLEEHPEKQMAFLKKIEDIDCAYVYAKDNKARITFANRKMLEVHGMSLQDIVGKTAFEIIPDRKNAETIYNDDMAVLRGEIERIDKEEMFVDASGGTHWVHTIKLPMKDEKGNIEGLCGISIDITEKKQAEETLRDTVQRFEGLLNNMSSGVAVYEAIDNGEDFIFKDFNKAAERIEKIKREDVIGKSVLEVFPSVKEFGLFEVFQRVWKTGQAEHFPVAIYKDERIVGWRENYVYKLPSSGEIVAVYDDVTDRKQVEDALRESEEKFRAITTTARDAILMMNDSGNIAFWNMAAERIFGYSSDEVIGKDLHKFIAPQRYYERYREGFSKFRKTGEGNVVDKTIELMGKKRDGTEFPIELSVSAVKIKGKWNAVAIIRDITERKQVEEEKRRLQEQLAHADRLATIGTLAGGVAHEINNPLMVISANSPFLREGVDVEERNEILKEIEDATHRIKEIVTDLLEFSRGDVEEFGEIDLNKVIDSSLNLLTHDIAKSGISVEKNVSPDLPPIFAHTGKLEEAILNLLTNAVYALDKRYPEPSDDKKLFIKAYPEEDRVILEIEDTGIGMSEEVQEHAFEPFFSTKHATEGTGLGLSVTYGIIKACGGDIEVESREGVGTKFTIYIPTYIPTERERRASEKRWDGI
ncbi:MAG: PAS domain S-box protein [Methermicoccaceae archaeon]